MAGLPARKQQSSPEPSKFQEKVAELVARGYQPAEIARLRFPGNTDEDKRRRHLLRKKLWRAVRSDAIVHQRVAEIAKAHLVMGVAPASQRLAKRSKRLGKSQDVKLLYEASGFHNSRVQHEHSGDIKITLDIPRPTRLSIEDDEVVDAEVVEE